MLGEAGGRKHPKTNWHTSASAENTESGSLLLSVLDPRTPRPMLDLIMDRLNPLRMCWLACPFWGHQVLPRRGFRGPDSANNSNV